MEGGRSRESYLGSASLETHKPCSILTQLRPRFAQHSLLMSIPGTGVCAEATGDEPYGVECEFRGKTDGMSCPSFSTARRVVLAGRASPDEAFRFYLRPTCSPILRADSSEWTPHSTCVTALMTRRGASLSTRGATVDEPGSIMPVTSSQCSRRWSQRPSSRTFSGVSSPRICRIVATALSRL